MLFMMWAKLITIESSLIIVVSLALIHLYTQLDQYIFNLNVELTKAFGFESRVIGLTIVLVSYNCSSRSKQQTMQGHKKYVFWHKKK